MKLPIFKAKGPSAKDLYIQGLHLLLEGRASEALSHFVESATLDSDNAAAYYHVGNIFRQRGSLNRAEAIFSELLKRHNLPWDLKLKIKFSLIRLALSRKESVRAQELIREAAAESLPSAGSVWVKEELLSLYEQSGRWQEAIDLRLDLDKIKGVSDPKRLAHYYLENGMALLKENGRSARIQFKEAIKQDPRIPWPYILIADSYFAENRTDDALEFWSKLLDAAPSRAFLIFERMEEYYYTAGDYGEVGRIYRRMVDAEPENLSALLALSRYLFKKGSRDEAAYYCRKALTIKPDSREAYIELLRQTMETAGSLPEVRGIVEGFMKMCSGRRRYLCRSCHTRSEVPHWRCSYCGAWDPFGLS